MQKNNNCIARQKMQHSNKILWASSIFFIIFSFSLDGDHTINESKIKKKSWSFFFIPTASTLIVHVHLYAEELLRNDFFLINLWFGGHLEFIHLFIILCRQTKLRAKRLFLLNQNSRSSIMSFCNI
jgi:hypothetical protein